MSPIKLNLHPLFTYAKTLVNAVQWLKETTGLKRKKMPP